MLASVERAFGSTSLKGRSVAVVGLGSVGLRLARLLARRGAKLVVADIDARKREDAARLGARWVKPEKAMLAAVDVLAPCALGAVLDDESVPALQAPVVAGAANNQLADESVADLLARRGVLWAPDFVANAGGIINISVELEPGGYDPRLARERVARDRRHAALDLRRGGRRHDAAGGGDGAGAHEPVGLARVARGEPHGIVADRHAHDVAAGGGVDQRVLRRAAIGREQAGAHDLGHLRGDQAVAGPRRAPRAGPRRGGRRSSVVSKLARTTS